MKQKAYFILFFAVLTTISSSFNDLIGIKVSQLEIDSSRVFQIDNDLIASTDLKILSRAYGYLKGQQYTLDRIKKELPELETQVTICELEFNLSFKKANERISSDLKKLLGTEFEKYEIEMNERLKSLYGSTEITSEFALSFIEEVKYRAKGKIESPVIETLFTYQYIDNPSKEFLDGFTDLFSTKDHPKAQGVNINLKLPISWDKQEGDRPHIVQKFFSENGKGSEGIILQIQDLGSSNDSKLSVVDLNKYFEENGLKQMVPPNGEFISAKKIKIDGLTAGQVVFKLKQERLDLMLSSEFIIYVMIIERKLVYLYCSVYAEKEETLNERFNLFLPLFFMVANSIVIMNQY